MLPASGHAVSHGEQALQSTQILSADSLPMAPQEITSRFGCQFISFLGASFEMTDMAELVYPTHTLSLSMPWEERYFITEAIDNLPDEALREGARCAFMAFFGCKSWVDAWKSVGGQLADRCVGYSGTTG